MGPTKSDAELEAEAKELAGKLWGALTLDALHAGTFDDAARCDLQRFTLVIEAAVRVTRLEHENRGLRLARSDVLESSVEHGEGEILGQSEAIRELLRELQVVADSELPVLLLGETGVGKELFARWLHRHSRRRNKPLVHVNCAALPESLGRLGNLRALDLSECSRLSALPASIGSLRALESLQLITHCASCCSAARTPLVRLFIFASSP